MVCVYAQVVMLLPASAEIEWFTTNNGGAMIMASSICVDVIFVLFTSDLYFQFTFQLKND